VLFHWSLPEQRPITRNLWPRRLGRDAPDAEV